VTALNFMNLITPYSDWEQFQVLEEFMDCVVGIVESDGFGPSVCYGEGKVIQTLIDKDGMSHAEAVEHFEFNIKRSAFGEFPYSFISTEL